ncbi:U-box domain [Dillenia turbinata]|uniref:U-box domain-containing protein n=1 Tax=Dillenia turbinata TaxID=194707 RepID=A0AAN8Z9G5_9MAGN
MLSSWRRRRANRRAKNSSNNNTSENNNMELAIPNHFRCPISLDMMRDPVTLSSGITYDRESIETWIEAGNRTCPITNQVLRSLDPIPNHTIRRMIQDWCVENRSYGVERIPTPRIPISTIEVTEMIEKISAARRRQDLEGCQELVRKVKELSKESERNWRCFTANGIASALSATFQAFAEESPSSSSSSSTKNVAVLEEALSCLPSFMPFDEAAKSYLGSSSSLRCMVWFLKHGILSARRNAILVLKGLVSSDQEGLKTLLDIEGNVEALVKLIKEPICPVATKASLVVIFHMISTTPSNETLISSFGEMGLVSLLLEMLVDSDRSACEKALGVFDEMCSCSAGREKAYEHALTVPVVVKKLLRISDSATEISVSILWKLCKNEKREEDGNALVEALQGGAFQKLLLLLQVGSSERTKEKATELLKMLNLKRGNLECIESIDFKNLKRSF